MLDRVVTWGRLVRFSHTVFALPFALSMAALCAARFPLSYAQFLFLLLALVSARSAAMSFNRVLDREIDALNPRTHARELPSGKLSVRSVKLAVLACSLAFVASAACLGRHCLYLSPLVLLVLFFYSYTKRFTPYSHYFLGLCLALAPGGVWYALSAQFNWLPVYMMLGVLFWVAGFDVLYACQDIDFDRAQNLHSLPARIGLKQALSYALALHLISVVFLALFGSFAGLGPLYFMALALFAALLASQHLLLKRAGTAQINAAFFTRNAWASVIYLLGMLGDLALR